MRIGHRISLKLALLLMLPFTAPANDDVENVIAEVKAEFAPDRRQTVFEITHETQGDGMTVLKGVTSDKVALEELERALDMAAIPYVDSVKVYPDDKWAQVRIAVACFRTAPGHASEMATQGIMGQPVRLLEKKGDCWRAQMPDGYIAYVVDNSLQEKNVEEMNRWKTTDRVIVTSPYQTRVYRDKSLKGVRNVLTDVVNGNILEGHLADGAAVVEVRLPDGRTGFVAASDVENFDKWASQTFDAEKLLDLAYSMEGTPYLWGGTSVKTLDCSGLAKVCYFSNGIILMRDASQQALTGEKLTPERCRECEAGDLLFFGNPKTGKVTHVAIYDQNGRYVHSSGRVKRNSIDPKAKDYLPTPFLSVSRIKNSIGTKGITRVSDHPWYFKR